MKGLYTILLLLASNTFMTLAWYGHLKFKEIGGTQNLSLLAIIVISWGLAFLEYCFMIPANRIGFKEMGGPFSLMQLKVIQEIITLTIFIGFTLIFFKEESFKWNHFAGFLCMILAVYFMFKK